MRIVSYILLLCLLLSSFENGLQAQKSTIKRATVTFEFPSKKVKGELSGFSSNSEIDLNDMENAVFSGSVQAATLDTNNGLRNWSLRGSRYFDVKEYPKIQFKSTAVKIQDDSFMVTGDLTIKGITRPFEIAWHRSERGLSGEGRLYSTDFDIKIKKKREDNLVLVFFDLELVR